jgi:deazaflavin-dependent oxidoreductase (nitroreductase family)
MTTMTDRNKAIIDEFRANDGRVGGYFEGHPLLLLHHKGARSHKIRVNPLAYQQLDDGSLAIFASRGGSPQNPDWFHNLKANPDAEIEVGTQRLTVRARVAEADERDRIWERQKELMPGFADYEKKTPRQIPVIVLELR